MTAAKDTAERRVKEGVEILLCSNLRALISGPLDFARDGDRELPRPAWLGDFPKTVEDLVLPAIDAVQHVERAPFGENQMLRIRAPNRILSRGQRAGSAIRQIKHRDLKFAASPDVERHLLPVR